ncbi:DNA primase [Candidatus Pacearchaeota archaeon]|nr:DNA primase [Candidatus Pacearchaeota archaeon]
MAKVSPVSIKYTISADFEADGLLEKPDVIGALFGQTEGLLGSDLELRELQKEGKIGRIEVELTTEGGKTKGEITIPSALDKAQTTIVAASLETIEKIGPTDAKIVIKTIDDVRGSKRDYIMERAKQLLAGISGSDLESSELGQELRESSRTMKITSYGDESLPAGDLSGNEIVVVEGRADVVNMLKHNISNVIGMNGAKLPKEIAKLGEVKELTLFVDGDRGGKLIATNVCDNAKIAFIAQAPDGKEVEELAGKELLLALRRKVTPSEFFKKFDRPTERYEQRDNRFSRDSQERYPRRDSYSPREYSAPREESAPKQKSDKAVGTDDKKKLKDLMSELRGKNVLVLDEKLSILRNVPMSKLAFMRIDEPVWILLTETASNSVIEGAQKLGARYVAAQAFGKIDNANGVELVSL